MSLNSWHRTSIKSKNTRFGCTRVISFMALLMCASLLISACGGLDLGSIIPGAGDGGQQAEGPGGTGDAGAGSGGASDGTGEPPAGGAGDAGDAGSFTDMFVPEDAFDLLGRLSVLAYRWEVISITDGEESPLNYYNEVRFEWLGQEEVDGEMTEKMHFTVDTGNKDEVDDIILWFNDEGLSVRAIVNGEEYMPELAAVYSEIIIPLLLTPFQELDSRFMDAMRADRISVASHSTERATIAGHDATVESFRGTGRMGGFPGGGDIELDVASILGLKMVLRGKVYDSDQSFELIFTPLEMESR